MFIFCEAQKAIICPSAGYILRGNASQLEVISFVRRAEAEGRVQVEGAPPLLIPLRLEVQIRWAKPQHYEIYTC